MPSNISYTITSCIVATKAASQEKFIKLKEKSITKNDKHTRDLNVGWYSEDDMVKVLKWSKLLGLKQSAVEHL